MSENFLPTGTILKSPFNSYRIEQVLGSGGFGITYRASTKGKFGNIVTTFPVAIKEHFMSADCQRGDDTKVVYSRPAAERVERARKDFVTEARRLSEVGNVHPNIVKVNEVFEANNTAYYVMEYLDGSTLRKYVGQRGRLTEAEALAMMQPVIEAIGTLHLRKITHLDIKPDNIMLRTADDGSLQPVLIDFGLSKHYDTAGNPTSTINVAGHSPGYAPFEQMVSGGVRQFSPVSDIYSLAATLYYCLTGLTPASPELDIDSPLQGRLDGLCSPAVAKALLAATQNKRNLRPQSAGELLQALRLTPSAAFVKAVAENCDATIINVKKPKAKTDDKADVKSDGKAGDKYEGKHDGKTEDKTGVEAAEKSGTHPGRLRAIIIAILIAAIAAVAAYFIFGGDSDNHHADDEVGTTIDGGDRFVPDYN